MQKLPFGTLVLCGLMFWPLSSEAQAPNRAAGEGVLRNVPRDQILGVAAVLSRLSRRIPGDVVHADLRPMQRRWIYDIGTLDRRGRHFEYHADAINRDILPLR